MSRGRLVNLLQRMGVREWLVGPCVGLVVVVLVVLAGERVRTVEEVRVQGQISSLVDAVGRLERSVVAVHAEGTGSGSGIVLNSAGLILTNSHVVGNSSQITVVDSSGTHTYRAIRLGNDVEHDVALLKLDIPAGLPAAWIDTSVRPEPGSAALAIGYAGGRALPAATTGTMAALNQSTRSYSSTGRAGPTLTGMIAIDVEAAPGDSGGAVFDSAGRVIGMITGVDADNRTTFAIPIDRAIQIAHSWATW